MHARTRPPPHAHAPACWCTSPVGGWVGGWVVGASAFGEGWVLRGVVWLLQPRHNTMTHPTTHPTTTPPQRAPTSNPCLAKCGAKYSSNTLSSTSCRHKTSGCWVGSSRLITNACLSQVVRRTDDTQADSHTQLHHRVSLFSPTTPQPPLGIQPPKAAPSSQSSSSNHPETGAHLIRQHLLQHQLPPVVVVQQRGRAVAKQHLLCVRGARVLVRQYVVAHHAECGGNGGGGGGQVAADGGGERGAGAHWAGFGCQWISKHFS